MIFYDLGDPTFDPWSRLAPGRTSRYLMPMNHSYLMPNTLWYQHVPAHTNTGSYAVFCFSCSNPGKFIAPLRMCGFVSTSQLDQTKQMEATILLFAVISDWFYGQGAAKSHPGIDIASANAGSTFPIMGKPQLYFVGVPMYSN